MMATVYLVFPSGQRFILDESTQTATLLHGAAKDGENVTVSLDALERLLRAASPRGEGQPATGAYCTLADVERGHIVETLKYVCKGNRREAAKMLGIGERTLHRKLQEYGMTSPRVGTSEETPAE